MVSILCVIPMFSFIVAIWISVVNLIRRVGRLEESLPDRAVEAGFVHRDHVRDPTHYDERGNYRWWGD